MSAFDVSLVIVLSAMAVVVFGTPSQRIFTGAALLIGTIVGFTIFLVSMGVV